ncbi:MAG: leucine-rich repeat domain-containing protein [Lachnospiraceae bacterium]|nr:leucine-rich repeat domain-containing protein [Lachnospiraceae bacterium]
MHARNKQLRKMLRSGLALTLAFSMAVPAGVLAEGTKVVKEKKIISDPEDPTLYDLTCSSEGKEGFFTASTELKAVHLDDSYQPVEIDVPQGAGATLAYYDNGIRYEGQMNGTLSAYEGAPVEVIPNIVPGYEADVEIEYGVPYNEQTKVDTYYGETFTVGETVNSNGYSNIGDDGTFCFTMPKKNITATVVYEKCDDVKVIYEDEESGKKVKISAQQESGEPKYETVPYNSLYTLPDAPEELKDIGNFYWTVFQDYKAYNYLPGDQIRIRGCSGEAHITPALRPAITLSEGLCGSEYRKNGDAGIFISLDPEYEGKKRIKSLTMKYVDDGEVVTKDIPLGLDGISFPYNKLPKTDENTKITIQAVLADADPEKETVIDLTSGSFDFANDADAEEAALQRISLFAQSRYDLKQLLVDRSGNPTYELTFYTLDLNHDGNLDIRDDATLTTSGKKHFAGVSIKESKEKEEKKAGSEIFRMAGAELCDQSTYSFESGNAMFGKVTIKLFTDYLVKYLDGERTCFEERVREGKQAKGTEDPVKEGYTFKGWQVAQTTVSGNSVSLSENPVGKIFDSTKPIMADTVLQAVWEKNRGEDKPEEKKDDSGKTDPAQPGQNPDQPAAKPVGAEVGTVLKQEGSAIVYTVTKQGDDKNMPEVSYSLSKKKQGKKKTVKIPATVVIDNVKYKVTTVTKGSLASEKRATKLVLGANIDRIASNALKGCKKLKTIKILNKAQVISLSKKSFAGTKGKITLLVPKKFYKKYKQQIRKLKLSWKVKVKSY